MKTIVVMVVAALAGALSAGCNSMNLRPSFGAVIKFEVMPGAAEKRGIEGVTDEGRRIFGHAGLRAPEILGRSGGTLSYVGAGIPKWVDVSWREGKFVLDKWNPETKTVWKGGTVVAKHRLQIANRIPPEVLKYASQGEDRAIRLIFRLKDDGVLLAWDVQEWYGGLWAYSLHGGDFPCDPVSPHASRPTCTSGYLKDAPWYHP